MWSTGCVASGAGGTGVSPDKATNFCPKCGDCTLQVRACASGNRVRVPACLCYMLACLPARAAGWFVCAIRE